MGLDVHFYNRKKVKSEQELDKQNVINEFINSSSNTELQQSLMHLKEYSLLSEESLDECLVKAINQFVERYSTYYDNDPCEVAYFRKFWWVLNFFGYSDSYYANDKPVSKEHIEEARNLAEKTIKMVMKHFTDKGFEIDQSPLEYKGDTLRFGGVKPEYLTCELPTRLKAVDFGFKHISTNSKTINVMHSKSAIPHVP